ncbi:hypothetical protein B0B39_01785 [Legionella longbeachae]|uniref:hypothetical protein n=1 Tax=Legionella longbeachae TaxID=450 RepID=UPI000A1C00E6|nr:hypothetical protein [Legionella longbeachae]ARM32339.1 hypothetical protein B0B39_01785 [Legionella longbeachae]
MDENISNYQNRNSIFRKLERFSLKFLLFLIIPISILSYIYFQNPRIINALSTLLSLTALIQLEVCGLFGYVEFLGNELDRIYEESGCVPSNITRSIFEFYNPEPGIKNYINNQLYFNKRIGFYLLLISGLLQLYINCFI